MDLYKLLKDLIEANYYEKEDMTNKLNVFYTFNQITLQEYTELMNMINGKVIANTGKKDTKEKVNTQ